MENMATKKELKKPKKRNNIWLWLKFISVFNRSKPVAAAIVGMANKKENSTIARRLIPKNKPPKIVAADLETPGIMAID